MFKIKGKNPVLIYKIYSVLRRRLLKLLIAVLLLLLFLFAYVFHAVSDIEVEGDVFSLDNGDKSEL